MTMTNESIAHHINAYTDADDLRRELATSNSAAALINILITDHLDDCDADEYDFIIANRLDIDHALALSLLDSLAADL